MSADCDAEVGELDSEVAGDQDRDGGPDALAHLVAVYVYRDLAGGVSGQVRPARVEPRVMLRTDRLDGVHLPSQAGFLTGGGSDFARMSEPM